MLGSRDILQCLSVSNWAHHELMRLSDSPPHPEGAGWLAIHIQPFVHDADVLCVGQTKFSAGWNMAKSGLPMHRPAGPLLGVFLHSDMHLPSDVRAE